MPRACSVLTMSLALIAVSWLKSFHMTQYHVEHFLTTLSSTRLKSNAVSWQKIRQWISEYLKCFTYMAQLKLMKDIFPEQHSLSVMTGPRPETSFLKNYRILGADSMIGKKESNSLTGNDQRESTQIWRQHLTVKCTDISSKLIYYQSVICGILFVASSMQYEELLIPFSNILVWIQFLGDHFWFGF